MYSSSFEISVTQHDTLRDLALILSKRGNINEHRRLVMAQREENGLLPKEWSRYQNRPFEAQIVSINTGMCKDLNLSSTLNCYKFSVSLCDSSLMNLTLQVK